MTLGRPVPAGLPIAIPTLGNPNHPDLPTNGQISRFAATKDSSQGSVV